MGKVAGIVIAIIIGIVMVSMDFSNMAELSEHTRTNVSDLLRTLPDYEQAGPWYEGLADQHHESVFDTHHKMGSKRTAASFDDMGYIHDLLDKMAADADRQNQKERAGYIRELRESVYIESDGPA